MGETRLDHLVLGTADLDRAVRWIEEDWGCAVLPGGRHPRWGTHNAVVPLEGGAYLEIVAPDPSAAPPTGPRIFGLDSLSDDRLVTWALRPEASAAAAGGEADRLPALAARMAGAGVPPGTVLPGERRTPEGTLLRWRLTDPAAERLGGVAPFLIDWGATPHPSTGGRSEVRVEAIGLHHPRPDTVRSLLAALALDDDRVGVDPGPVPAMTARFHTPRGPRGLPRALERVP